MAKKPTAAEIRRPVKPVQAGTPKGAAGVASAVAKAVKPASRPAKMVENPQTYSESARGVQITAERAAIKTPTIMPRR